MDPQRFDAFTRTLGSGQSRRRLLKTLTGGAIAVVAAAVGLDRTAAHQLRSVGNSCNTNSDCASGLCVQEGRTRKICHCVTPADCPPSTDVCHAASCSAGACSLTVLVGAPCDDGDACTTSDVCQTDGTCAGTPVSCQALDQCHLAGTCDPTTGVCSNPAAPDRTSCTYHPCIGDNGNVVDPGTLCCDAGETCQSVGDGYGYCTCENNDCPVGTVCYLAQCIPTVCAV